MRQEGFDFTKDTWSETSPVTDVDDLWAGNIAVPHLVFDNLDIFKSNTNGSSKLLASIIS